MADITRTAAPHGRHLIAGDWVESAESFLGDPVLGEPRRYGRGGAVEIARAAEAAEAAFPSYGWSSRAERAAFLDRIAEEIDARGDAIAAVATAETGLPQARIVGERGRTTGQLRLFARYIGTGAHLDIRHDAALPERTPLPRPHLTLIQRPLGPVGVFGASNFPLAFSTAGGDTASALAAGCPVVVKGHPAHPGTSALVAEAIDAAIRACGIDPGVFSLVHSDTREAGEALVTHPLIRAIGFTGSLAGGRALFDLAARRSEPIPFFGELGSVNPVFLLPRALRARGDAIAQGWAASLTMGVGQFCTNPGLVVAPEGPPADPFEAAARAALAEIGPHPMLTRGIAEAYRAGRDRLAARGAPTRAVVVSACAERDAAPDLVTTTGEAFLADPALGHEVFGPLGLMVRVRDAAEMLALAHALEGQLTATLHMEEADMPLAARLVPVLERKAGRLLVNGFSTGVEVADAMMHGGPYPASTNPSATSVGTLAIRRFLRPVCYQDMPEGLLPEDARG